MKQAKPVWICKEKNKSNQFAGFHVRLSLTKNQTGLIRIAARSYYQLYLDGIFIAAGPARTAEGYCRIDEIPLKLRTECDIAIEVAAYKTGNYCNDCTMEPGMLAVEVLDEAGNVLSATGGKDWTCEELLYRRDRVETMSHSRGIVEYYDLTPESYTWRTKRGKQNPCVLAEKVSWLKRRSPCASFQRLPMSRLSMLYDETSAQEKAKVQPTALAKIVNASWYARIPAENLFLEQLANEKELPFSGQFSIESDGKTAKEMILISPGDHPPAAMWELPESQVGFWQLSVRVEQECILDVINGDALSEKGQLEGNSYAARYVLAPGSYRLISFEPRLIRYLKCVFRTQGKIRIFTPEILDDTYPDNGAVGFSCNDGDLNRIYAAARKTLRLNTLDIFMDCPQRERGGWLCDSWFSARGAWQMFGDLRVEKDFLENFLLTDPDQIRDGFFPEVYPGIRGEKRDVGIRNWSFWLMLELCDYCDRSGDIEFAEKHRRRVEQFVEGVLSLRGDSGLLEEIGTAFVDWSLSNETFALEPVSLPINCLAVCMLNQLASLYGQKQWRTAAKEMERVIDDILPEKPFSSNGDAVYKEKRSPSEEISSGGQKTSCILRRGGCRTESGVALEIWSGFHQNDVSFLRKFTETMGSCPKRRPDPNIGKANLFIGLMIRFDVLARMGKAEELIREWKDLYLEELKLGSGTLFEGIADTSGCHGFNGYVGTLMTNVILGLGMPMQRTKTIKISPHPGTLKWAGGSAVCEDGKIFLRWQADHEKHLFDMMLYLPNGWKAEFDFPFELNGWNVKVNGKEKTI